MTESEGSAKPEEPGSDHPLRESRRPEFEKGEMPVTVVDLFAGCGGLSLGAALAARRHGRPVDIRLAVDHEDSATEVYAANFPGADVRTAGVETLFAAPDGGKDTDSEVDLATTVGDVDFLMGGPPCQGHSNLNNHTRRNDPKNALYLYVVRAAQVLRPRAVLIENVPAVLHDTFDRANVVQTARDELKLLGYEVDDAVVSLVDLGVAQKRKRHILLATSDGMPEPSKVFASLRETPTPRTNLRWAIGDLEHTAGQGWDKPPRASADNQDRMQWLIDMNKLDLPNQERPTCHQGEHSYVSMYGRLSWDNPAQTITSGFGSIGQGRYMHPSQKRALTAHEAARIQGFPDYFDFSSVALRSDLATMVGNAVPPQLSECILGWLLGATGGTTDHVTVAEAPPGTLPPSEPRRSSQHR